MKTAERQVLLPAEGFQKWLCPLFGKSGQSQMKELIIWLNHPPWQEFSFTTWSLEPVCLQHSGPKYFGGLLLEECDKVLQVNFSLMWGLGKSVSRHLAKFSGGVCVWGWRGWYKWIVPDQGTPHGSFSSALFSPVPGGLTIHLRCAAGAILRITLSITDPLHPTESPAQEILGSYHRTCSWRGLSQVSSP